MTLTNNELQQILIYLLFKNILDLNNNISTFYKASYSLVAGFSYILIY